MSPGLEQLLSGVGVALITSAATLGSAKMGRRTKRQEKREDFTAVTNQQGKAIERLEKRLEAREAEADRMETRQSRLEALVRAFAWTTERWSRQMTRAGIEPEPAHPLVDEYNRTGV